MDARELLMSVAPKEIPDWFEPKMKIKKPMPTSAMISMTKEEWKQIVDCGFSIYATARSFGEDALQYMDIRGEVTDAIRDWLRLKKLEQQYDDEYKKEKLLQWPSAYADMVIERSK